MKRLLAELSHRLEQTDRDGLRRVLREPVGVDFTSNDYLGLSRHPHLRETLQKALHDGDFSAPASRLLRGHTRAHHDIEERLAEFKEADAALLFPSGYQANIAILSSLLGSADFAASDALNHASIIDGLRLAGAQKTIYPHLNLDAAERALHNAPGAGQKFLVTESYFSMEGSVAPLKVCAEIADRQDAALIVDDAHATGIFGLVRGSGLCEHQGVERRAACVLSTGGKGLGLWGAFVTGPRQVMDYLLQRARPFLFSTAVSPLLAAGLGAALDVIASEPQRRQRVWMLADRLRLALGKSNVVTLGQGPIVPVLLGDNRLALHVQTLIALRGYDVRVVRPPSVAPGTARARICVHADHTEDEIDGVAHAVIESIGLARGDA